MLNLKMRGTLLDSTDHMIFQLIIHCLDIHYCWSKLIFESGIKIYFTLEHIVSQQQNISHVDWWTLQLQSPTFVLYDVTVVSDDDVSIVSLTDRLSDECKHIQIMIAIKNVFGPLCLILFVPQNPIINRIQIFSL